MSSGNARGGNAAPLAGAATAAGVGGVDEPAVEQAAGDASRSAGPRRRPSTSTPMTGSSRSAMPRTGAPPTIGETPTTAPASRGRASRMPGTARIVPIETTGLDGGKRTTSAVGDRLEHAGRRACASGAPTGTTSYAGRRCSRTQYSWKWTARRPPSASRRRSPHGSRPGRRSSAAAARRAASGRTAPRSPRTAGSRRRASASARCGWRSRGRRARTRSARRRTPPAPPWRATSRRRDPSRAPRRCRRRACTSPCRGRGRPAARTARCRRRCCR